MEISSPDKSLSFDPEKAATILEELIEVFQRHKPTVGEILTVSSNLLYTLGASIGEYGEKGPGFDELKKLYYEESGRMDVALMLQGMQMATWFEDWEKLQITKDSSNSGEDNNEPTSARRVQRHGR
jgi:hypothetical protein